MLNNIEELTEFFPSSNLNNFSFYFYCPSLKEEEKREMSEIIIKNKGVSSEELLEVLVSAQPGIDRAEALAALKERENKMTTGIIPGIAVPHAISNSVKGVVGAIGISRNGIDFGSLDNKPVHVVFMLLFSPNETERHLQIMKQFAGLLHHQELCNSLVKAKSAEEICDLICSCEKSM